jgi:hypothetical protein
MLEEVESSQIFKSEEPTEIEVTLAEFDKMVEQKKALDRLLVNPDFQAIIVKGYLEDDYNRLADLLKNTVVNRKVVEDRAIIVDKMVSKGYLENWIATLQKTTEGIDNPEQRAALVKELENLEGDEGDTNE